MSWENCNRNWDQTPSAGVQASPSAPFCKSFRIPALPMPDFHHSVPSSLLPKVSRHGSHVHYCGEGDAEKVQFTNEKNPDSISDQRVPRVCKATHRQTQCLPSVGDHPPGLSCPIHQALGGPCPHGETSLPASLFSPNPSAASPPPPKPRGPQVFMSGAQGASGSASLEASQLLGIPRTGVRS